MRFARKNDSFTGQLKFSNVDLKQFIDEQNLKWDVRGYLCGTVNLSGLTSDRNSLVGGAELQIRDGQLAKINVVASMLIQLFNLDWPGGGLAITDLGVLCRLKEGVVKFGDDPSDERAAIVLFGQGVPITGAGTITLSGDMDLVFVTSKESKGLISGVLEFIPGVGWAWRQISLGILKPIRDTFLNARVTGNVKDAEPKVTAQKLDAVGDVLIQPLKAFGRLVSGSPKEKEQVTEPKDEPPPKK